MIVWYVSSKCIYLKFLLRYDVIKIYLTLFLIGSCYKSMYWHDQLQLYNQFWNYPDLPLIQLMNYNSINEEISKSIFIDLELQQCQAYACGYTKMMYSAMIMRKVSIFPFSRSWSFFLLTLSYVMANIALYWIIRRYILNRVHDYSHDTELA